uniref:Pseudouridylate synthase RPUSD4, mitochondrial n=1 Tax=Saccoglossus kowalevskii TaxID=10224 RepID=A0ABM0GXD0_SACKO|nr:PREDICTED: RNA pseudouridylate synthase domain-containing protein 4-like [Saccoglossus kowalevskii]
MVCTDFASCNRYSSFIVSSRTLKKFCSSNSIISTSNCLVITRHFHSSVGRRTAAKSPVHLIEEDFFGLTQEGTFDKFSDTQEIKNQQKSTRKPKNRKKVPSTTPPESVRHEMDGFLPNENDIVVEDEEHRVKRNETPEYKNAARTVSMNIRKKLSAEKSNTYQDKQTTEHAVPQSSPKQTDSMGFRVCSHETQDLSRLSPFVVAKILHERIIYDHDDVIAIDKPYGLPSHGGPTITNNVNDTLTILAKLIDKSLPKLYLVHRLDKETTGVMLLAKSEIIAKQLNALFRKKMVIKRYWVLTVGVPEPSEGVVDIPMEEGEVAGKNRMLLRPDYGLVYKNLIKSSSGKGATALTNFKVLASEGNCALVELQPETGIKHQIRCHLASGLGCPILGDHKYSHHDKLAPQKLPGDMLQRLNIRQAKVRTVPMHLHAKQLIIPQFRDGRNLFISTKLPEFFKKNMTRLKIQIT